MASTKKPDRAAIIESAVTTIRRQGVELEKIARASRSILGDTPLTQKLKAMAGAAELHARSIERRLELS